jgi:hypothetical protein
MHFTPAHCSWMNQVEQWLSILQRKRLRATNFADLADLEAKDPRLHRRVEPSRSPVPLDHKVVRESAQARRRSLASRPHWSDGITMPALQAAA